MRKRYDLGAAVWMLGVLVAAGCNGPREAPILPSSDPYVASCVEECGAGRICDAGACVPGGECGLEHIEPSRAAPNVLVVLDRSCSMNQPLADGTKWTAAVDAVARLVAAHPSSIRFGLTLFPDTDASSCEQGAAAAPTAADSAASILAILDAALDPEDQNFPDGPCVTNLDAAALQAESLSLPPDPERASFVLLITDGKQAGCSDLGGDPTTEATLARMRDAGVATFVVGFGDGVAPKQLDELAEAGGVPRTGGGAKYHDASDAASLDAALDEIASQTVGCAVSLDETAPDPSELYVFFDGERVPEIPSHAEGWDHDPVLGRLDFFGAACADLEAREIDDLDVVFGCAP